MTLTERCNSINDMFTELSCIDGTNAKATFVRVWRAEHIDLVKDLDFCFEVLAGKHKLGYTYILNTMREENDIAKAADDLTIENFVNNILKRLSATDADIVLATMSTPKRAQTFIYNLVNRIFRLGYSNKNAMIDRLSPMLAKKYPETFRSQYYYIQEKLDGNRCIAYFDECTDSWRFRSRSGKPLKVDFDMSWADKSIVFDGEIMTLGKAGTRDFNRTSGAINGKYTDKSALHYFIYDIVDEYLTYSERKEILDKYEYAGTGNDCQILPVLDKVWVWPNISYNNALDNWLDTITAKGGEGIMLRDPDAVYQCGKRSDALLKYKKVQTMDLRIIDWNEGNGKYEGCIGSFVCETDDHTIQVNVSGMPDDIHYSDPTQWIGKIIEVAYFDISKSTTKDTYSLRFPRLKRIREDKDTTSIY